MMAGRTRHRPPIGISSRSPSRWALPPSKNLVEAIEKKDPVLAGQVARQHMDRYSENIDTIYQQIDEYFAK